MPRETKTHNNSWMDIGCGYLDHGFNTAQEEAKRSLRIKALLKQAKKGLIQRYGEKLGEFLSQSPCLVLNPASKSQSTEETAENVAEAKLPHWLSGIIVFGWQDKDIPPELKVENKGQHIEVQVPLASGFYHAVHYYIDQQPQNIYIGIKDKKFLQVGWHFVNTTEREGNYYEVEAIIDQEIDKFFPNRSIGDRVGVDKAILICVDPRMQAALNSIDMLLSTPDTASKPILDPAPFLYVYGVDEIGNTRQRRA